MKFERITWWLSVAAVMLCSAIYAWQLRLLMAAIGAGVGALMIAEAAISKRIPFVGWIGRVALMVALWVLAVAGGMGFVVGAGLWTLMLLGRPSALAIMKRLQRRRKSEVILIEEGKLNSIDSTSIATPSPYSAGVAPSADYMKPQLTTPQVAVCAH